MSIDQLRKDLISQKTTAQSQVTLALQKAKSAADKNVFVEIYDEASDEAKKIDDQIRAGQELGPLAGIPFSVKDNFLLKGRKTTASAPFLANFIAPYTATCLAKLKAAGAILIGKTNLDAFAHGTSTENSYFGPTKNPVDESKTPGGSSGGSAAAVALDCGLFSLGTDTGGSVRLPASFCGVVGYKPTYGLLSRYGIVAMASSTDCVAPLTQSVNDARLLGQILAGPDKRDGTTITDKTDWQPDLPAKPRLGLISQFKSGLDPVVDKAFGASLKIWEDMGAQIREVSLPSLKLSLACYYVLVSAEISSNLSRYNGLLYGQQVLSPDLKETIDRSRGAGFMAENKRRIILGTYVLSQGYYDAYYKRAQRLRTKLVSEIEAVFEQVDALISPVCPTPAFSLGQKTDPVQMYLADLMTVGASLAGIPAVSVPAPTDGLPVGLQIMTPQKQDGLALALAQKFEEAR